VREVRTVEEIREDPGAETLYWIQFGVILRSVCGQSRVNRNRSGPV
jgi:hypothetical protein